MRLKMAIATTLLMLSIEGISADSLRTNHLRCGLNWNLLAGRSQVNVLKSALGDAAAQIADEAALRRVLEIMPTLDFTIGRTPRFGRATATASFPVDSYVLTNGFNSQIWNRFDVNPVSRSGAGLRRDSIMEIYFAHQFELNGRVVEMRAKVGGTTDSMIRARGYYSQMAPDVTYYTRQDNVFELFLKTEDAAGAYLTEDERIMMDDLMNLARDITRLFIRQAETTWGVRNPAFDTSVSMGGSPSDFVTFFSGGAGSYYGQTYGRWINNARYEQLALPNGNRVNNVRDGEFFLSIIMDLLALERSELDILRAAIPRTVD